MAAKEYDRVVHCIAHSTYLAHDCPTVKLLLIPRLVRCWFSGQGELYHKFYTYNYLKTCRSAAWKKEHITPEVRSS